MRRARKNAAAPVAALAGPRPWIVELGEVHGEGGASARRPGAAPADGVLRIYNTSVAAPLLVVERGYMSPMRQQYRALLKSPIDPYTQE